MRAPCNPAPGDSHQACLIKALISHEALGLFFFFFFSVFILFDWDCWTEVSPWRWDQADMVQHGEGERKREKERKTER